MRRYIALLRGINVGGKNRMSMAELRELISSLDCQNVQTVIQSGNVVFDSPRRSSNALEKVIREAIVDQHEIDTHVLVRTHDNVQSAVQRNPFPEADGDPTKLQLFFTSQPVADADLETMESLRKPSEQFLLDEDVFFLYAPDGIGRSKLAAKAEKLLGVPATCRNLNTVRKLLALATN